MARRSVDTACIAFLDLIGIKEAAAHGAENYLRKIVQFHETLKTWEGILEGHAGNPNDARVYLYSDCAFIRSAHVIPLLDYLEDVRWMLLAQDEPIFFKAAVVHGKLGERPVGNSLFIGDVISSSQERRITDDRGSQDRTSHSIVYGIGFSRDAVKAYVEHQFSKAIGVRVADAFVHLPSLKERVNSSMHFPKLNDSPLQYWDLAFKQNPLEYTILERILLAMYMGRMQEVKFERYYTSLLVNWMKSMPLPEPVPPNARGSGNEPAERLKDESRSRDIFAVITNKVFEKRFPGSYTILYFYYSVLDTLYNTYLIVRDDATGEKHVKDNAAIPVPLDEVEEYLLGLKRIQKNVSSIPDFVMDSFTKHLLLRRLVTR